MVCLHVLFWPFPLFFKLALSTCCECTLPTFTRILAAHLHFLQAITSLFSNERFIVFLVIINSFASQTLFKKSYTLHSIWLYENWTESLVSLTNLIHSHLSFCCRQIMKRNLLQDDKWIIVFLSVQDCCSIRPYNICGSSNKVITFNSILD